MNNMDYKKLAECVRLCGNTPEITECQERCPYYSGTDISKCITKMTSDAADAIEDLLGRVEQMKNLHMKVQVDCEELTIKEVCDKIERLKKERDKYKSLYEYKNTPKSPFDEDGDIMACAYCGSGEFLYNEDGNRNNYCGQCGQRIDWGDFE